MAFWLAKKRTGQRRDWMMRFDPRFWTVDFPRPEMASVVTTAPDALRVDCEFHTRGGLAGLIWASEDTLDHPLLAYATVRDYAHCVLRFRWRSGGALVALDQVNGPTLTIEGRDAAGHPRSWYVRLWNYATGTGTDAQVELRFSTLQSGWTLPGEPVHPAAIDRMFISLAPAGYAEGSTEIMAARANGWVELSGIACEGENALLPIGDVMIPAHGEQMATAYDDSYNQTPARLLRSVEGLGYRGRIVHYVGMSHYFRLRPFSGQMMVVTAGELCEPARAWHRDFFARAVAMDFAPIVSLSFELLAQHCPSWWRQASWDGRAGETGWDPPSNLLTPAQTTAVAFLKSVATAFVGLLREAGAAVLFQIGEPWFWIHPDTRAPCLYDAKMVAALGGNPAVIADMRLPMTAAQKQVLDDAGAILASATAAVTQAVRAAAMGPSEVMLLAFTPTVLDPEMPEAYRLNLPAGWAWPAFDRLQLEDYDWLTAGADAARAAGIAFVEGRLGYPVDRQDYLAGFVLDPADAHDLWPRIDRALDAARRRGVTQRFVWALPQVARDGYTRLPPPQEDPMEAFDDVPYPLALGRDAAVSPEFSTTVAVTASGHERRNALWSDARLRFDVGPGVRSHEELTRLVAFFRARYGPARGFRLRDPFDFSSNGMDGAPTPADQPLGTGDGLACDFQLAKHYGEQRRAITRPDPASIVVSVAGLPATGWTHEGLGLIRFAAAPPAGAEVRAGFLFDVPVRFAEDRLDVSGVAFAAGEAPSVPLIEIREEAAA